MIDKLFPTTVSNILDYDVIKVAAERYVERLCVEVVENYARNLLLQTMDADHIKEVAQHVSGDSTMSVDDLLDYMNSENVYRECDFVSDLQDEFGSSVTYKLFEETYYFALGGWYLPDYVEMTTGGTGKAGMVILEGDDNVYSFGPGGLSEIDKWLGDSGVAAKLPVNLYIEIQNHITVTSSEASPLDGTAFDQSYPYIEEEVFVTNDPYYAIPEPSPEPPTPPVEDWEDVTGYPIAVEISASGTSMSNVVCTKQGSDELDLTQYRINPAVMDMEANGYDFVALAKFLANNKLYQAFMSAAKVTYVAYVDNYPNGYGVFQFNQSGALGISSASSWNTLVGLPLKFEPSGGGTTYNGFITNYNASYPYPNKTQQIGRSDSTGMVDALKGDSYSDGGHFIVDNGAEGSAAALVDIYIRESVDAVVVNADSGKPIVLDYDQSTGKLSFYFARKYVKWEAMNIKGQDCAAFRVVFRLGGTYNGHALIQRYIGETPLTPPVPTAPQLKTAFMRGANYQNANKSVAANSSEALYDDGASVTLLVDGSKTYTLLRAYNKDDVELDITGASLVLSASGSNYQLKLNWGATAAQICYIEYTVS